jgi:hypothetical protein
MRELYVDSGRRARVHAHHVVVRPVPVMAVLLLHSVPVGRLASSSKVRTALAMSNVFNER